MQAIITKFYGPTSTRGPRIKARAWAGSVTVAYQHALGVEGSHEAAARALCEKLGWEGKMIGGGMPDDSGYAFVFTPDVGNDD